MADNIIILMATYNGEKYVAEQLESIIKQSYKNWKLIIHDDFSTDNTSNVLKEYIRAYPNKIIQVDSRIKFGAKESFLWLLENTSGDYYMFCDQDDVWLPTKIEDTLNRMQEVEKEYPDTAVMIHTDLAIVDENLSLIHNSFWNWGKFNVDLNKKFNYCPIGNVFTGCTMMINDRAKQFIFHVSKHAQMHDEWIGLIVSKYGVVENLKKQTILYRQHGNNVCSIGTRKKFILNMNTIKKLYRWYYQKKDLLEELNYGNVWYAMYNKLKYDLIRIFKTNH